MRNHGHPDARDIPAKEYRGEVGAVRALLTENASHPGLVAALRFLDALMQNARAGEGLSDKAQTFPSAPEVARLARHGVQPLDILATLFGCLYWQGQHPRALPDDRARDFALSRAVLKLAPRAVRQGKGGQRYDRPKFAALEHLGRFLRQELASLYPMVSQALDTQEEQQRAALAAMRAPFKVPTPPLSGPT